MQNWDDLRFFLSVARKGTVSSAADFLHVNQSTVSRRINTFEGQLNVRLFERLSSGYELTVEGKQLLAFAERIEYETTAIQRQLVGINEMLAGPIRVTAPLTLSTLLFVEIFVEFHSRYPDIEIQVVATNTLQNISQREADIALRVSDTSPPENLIGRKLGDIEFGVFGSTNYLRKYHGGDEEVALSWIGEDNQDIRPSWLPVELAPIKLAMRSNDPWVTAQAIRQDIGVGRLPVLFKRQISDLQQFNVEHKIPSKPLWLITHPDLRRAKRVGIFLDFVTEKVREQLHKQY